MITDPPPRKRKETLKKPIPALMREARAIELITKLKVTKAIPPLFPGQYPPSALMNWLNTSGRKAIDTLTLIRNAIERYEESGVPVENERIKSLLKSVEHYRQDFNKIFRIASQMSDVEVDKITRGESRLSELVQSGASERQTFRIRSLINDARVGAEQYSQVMEASRLTENLVHEGLESIKDRLMMMGI